MSDLVKGNPLENLALFQKPEENLGLFMKDGKINETQTKSSTANKRGS